ncbi:unnamed protein product [Musa acuminata subsp. malaccensis]|uniref:(wild Malaysian banana) hypothetical protein n=1 Tax=Musa acuminata subsp. malaccensis TaxID=214687 RepID=A0A804KNI5_MUSAM|nr:unnamed protein product [Musa acuminata subsp. malaccensis]
MSTSQSPKVRDVELGSLHSDNTSDYGMEDFFKQVTGIEKMMEKISNHLKKLQEANENSKSATKASSMKKIRQQMEKDVDEVGKIAHMIKTKLQEIDRDNLANRKKPGCEKGTGVDRSRMALTAALKKKSKDRMNDFQNLRKTIQDENREVVERAVFTVTGTLPTDEMIDRLIATGNNEQIFQRQFKKWHVFQIIDIIEEIQERNDAVFMDMAVLVEAQEEILDNIESQVATAMNHVQSGNNELLTAKSLSKRSRKCMFIAIVILLAIAAVIVLSILKPWK